VPIATWCYIFIAALTAWVAARLLAAGREAALSEAERQSAAAPAAARRRAAAIADWEMAHSDVTAVD